MISKQESSISSRETMLRSLKFCRYVASTVIPNRSNYYLLPHPISSSSSSSSSSQRDKPPPSSTAELARVLGSLAKAKDYSNAILLYKQMVEARGLIAPNKPILTILLNCYCRIYQKCRCSLVHLDLSASLASAVLAKILMMGYRPDTITVTRLTEALLLSNHKYIDEGIYLHDAALAQGCRPDRLTYKHLIYAFCDSGNCYELDTVLDRMQRVGVLPDVAICNTLIRFLCIDHRQSKALYLFFVMDAIGIPPNYATYSCLIQGLHNYGYFAEVVDVGDEMVLRGFKPKDVRLFNILIDSMCNEGEVEKALDMVDVMIRDGVKPNHVTFGCLIYGYCQLNDISNATKVFAIMKPNAYCCNQLLNGLCNTEMLEDAVSLFEGMLAKNLTPYPKTVNTLIGALCKFDRVDQAWTFHQEMCCRAQSTDTATYTILLNYLCKEGDYNKAFQCFLETHDGNIKLDGHTLKALIDRLCRGGRYEAAQLVYDNYF